MGAHTQRLGHALPASTTVLRRERGWHSYNSTPGACCLGFEAGPKRRPAGIADALGEVRGADHVGHPQIFERDRVVLAQQVQGGLVVEVLSLALHPLLGPLET